MDELLFFMGWVVLVYFSVFWGSSSGFSLISKVLLTNSS